MPASPRWDSHTKGMGSAGTVTHYYFPYAPIFITLGRMASMLAASRGGGGKSCMAPKLRTWIASEKSSATASGNSMSPGCQTRKSFPGVILDDPHAE